MNVKSASKKQGALDIKETAHFLHLRDGLDCSICDGQIGCGRREELEWAAPAYKRYQHNGASSIQSKPRRKKGRSFLRPNRQTGGAIFVAGSHLDRQALERSSGSDDHRLCSSSDAKSKATNCI